MLQITNALNGNCSPRLNFRLENHICEDPNKFKLKKKNYSELQKILIFDSFDSKSPTRYQKIL